MNGRSADGANGAMAAHRLPSINVLGTRVHVLNMPGAVALIESWLREDRFGRYVCVSGVHGVMESLRDPAIRRVHNRADAVVPDGVPLVWLGWWHAHRSMGRVYGPDLMLSLLDLAARMGYTNYFFGGKPGVADELQRRMEQRFPGLRVVGSATPPFRPLTEDEEEQAVAAINRLQPDLLWIGLSTPKQEVFMARLQADIRAKVMIGVGAAFDFNSGVVRQAPRWMQRAGIEWLFRLAMEPRRLGPRYLRNNPRFLWHVLLQCSGRRAYPIDTE
jgi:N-acetylglucosaminyldiphosphoundecaprenol N-acetyl-beta-D-mannosaminyltransferase